MRQYLRARDLEPYIAELVSISSRTVCLGLIEEIFDEADAADIEADGFHLLHARFTCSSVASSSDSSPSRIHQTISVAQQTLARSVIDSIVEVANVASLFEEGFNIRKALRFHVICRQATLASYSNSENSDLVIARWQFIKAVLKSFQSSRDARMIRVVDSILEELQITKDPSFAEHIAIAGLDDSREFEAAFLRAVTSSPTGAEE